MEEGVDRTWMTPHPALVNRNVLQNKGYNSKTETVIKSEIELGLLFMVPDLVHKYQIICFRGTWVIEQTAKAGLMEVQTLP